MELAHQALLATLYFSRAVVHHNLGQHELALADAQQVIQHYPASPFGYLQAADICLGAKDYRAAYLVVCDGKKAAKQHRDDNNNNSGYSLLIEKKSG